MKRLIIQIALVVASIFLIYLVYESIMEPVRFQKSVDDRNEVIIEKIKQIKDLQVEFKKQHGHYSTTFDSLIDFYNTGRMPIVLKSGSVDTLSDAQALKLGLITRDTSFVSIKDTLFKNVENFKIEKLAIVPFTHGKVLFELETSSIVRASFVLPVMEIRCYMKDYLEDVKEKELLKNQINLLIEMEKFPGLKLGSLEDVSLEGNWQ